MISILDISTPLGFSISLTMLMLSESHELLNCKENHVPYHSVSRRDLLVVNSLHRVYGIRNQCLIQNPSKTGYQFQLLVSRHIPDHK